MYRGRLTKKARRKGVAADSHHRQGHNSQGGSRSLADTNVDQSFFKDQYGHDRSLS